ncbi:MAG TPA: hypothetical protein VGJ05_02435 [Fimbriiglobus sp.]|jgi:hypothetical protein
MNAALIDEVAKTVLYEGYTLYPYRPSVKNRQRWTFGGLVPRSYSEATSGSDAWTMRTECLVRGNSETVIDVEVRFLHLIDRRVGVFDRPQFEIGDDAEPPREFVDSLTVGDRRLQAWQEAEERRVPLGKRELHSLMKRPDDCDFGFPACRATEPVRDPIGTIPAALVRTQYVVLGTARVIAEAVATDLYRLRLDIENRTPLPQPDSLSRDEAMLHALVSTHSILSVHGGEFVSSIDPPEDCREHAAACQNIGAWPVLVGNDGDTSAMLSSPIILYDYPAIASESPGDFFDNLEIDEILTLRIQTLTHEEKADAAAVDERVRALLQRTESMSPSVMQGLHGTFRGLKRSVP